MIAALVALFAISWVGLLDSKREAVDTEPATTAEATAPREEAAETDAVALERAAGIAALGVEESCLGAVRSSMAVVRSHIARFEATLTLAAGPLFSSQPTVTTTRYLTLFGRNGQVRVVRRHGFDSAQ